MQTVLDGVWHVAWLLPILAIAIWIDSIGEIAGWMMGTPVEMATASRGGHLPETFTRSPQFRTCSGC